MIATYLAIIRAGGIAVATMPLLRPRELAYILEKARITLAVSDHRLLADLETAQTQPQSSKPSSPRRPPAQRPHRRDNKPTAASPRTTPPPDDVCLIAFTSGTTGQPKGTMHFHRDMLAIRDSDGAQVLQARPGDIFIGTAPIAFTFGLGGLRPLSAPHRRLGHPHRARLPREPPANDPDPPPDRLLHRADRLPRHARPAAPGDTSSCASASPPAKRSRPHLDAWREPDRHQDHGRHRLDRDAAHLHRRPRRPAPAGLDRAPVPGYEAKLIDVEGNDLPPGSTGRLAVRGPTGCRYLADIDRPTTSKTAGTSPATPSARTRTATSGSRPAPTT